MYVKAKVKVKAKVGDKVSQLMVKKLNKPVHNHTNRNK